MDNNMVMGGILRELDSNHGRFEPSKSKFHGL